MSAPEPTEKELRATIGDGTVRALVIGWINARDITQELLESLPKSKQLAERLPPSACEPGSGGHFLRLVAVATRRGYYLKTDEDRRYALLWMFRLAARTEEVPKEFKSTRDALAWAAQEAGAGAIKVFAAVGVVQEDVDDLRCITALQLVGSTRLGTKNVKGRRTYTALDPLPDTNWLVRGRRLSFVHAGAPGLLGVLAMNRITSAEWCDIGSRIALDYDNSTVAIRPQTYPTYSVYVWNGRKYELREVLGSSRNPWHNFRKSRGDPPEFA